MDSKIPKLDIFVDKNSKNDQTPFPKVGRKTPDLKGHQGIHTEENAYWFVSVFLRIVFESLIDKKCFTSNENDWTDKKFVVKDLY